MGHPVQLLTALTCGTSECLHFCGNLFHGSCRGSSHDHNKFITLSKLSDGRKNVIALTSANWNDGQLYWYNDLIVVANDSILFSRMMDYFEALLHPDDPFPLFLGGERAVIHVFPNG